MIFLRPFLLLFLLIPLFLWLLKKNASFDNPWSKFIDAQILPFLLIHKKTKSSQKKFFFGTLVWSLLCISMAGPSIGTVQTPTYLNSNSTAIIVDLSPSMSGSNLIKLKSKLTDLLPLLADEQIALVLYDEKGYIVTPFTHDKNIIQNIIPVLDPNIMPGMQNNPIKGFQKSVALFDNMSQSAGRIFFITSGAFDAQKLKNYTQTLPYEIAILHIPNPAIPLDPILTQIGAFQTLTLDNADLQNLISKTPLSDLTQHNATQTRADFGPYILLLALPLLALFFRRNFIFMMILLIALPTQAGFFRRSDQQSYHTSIRAVQSFDAQNYQRAADLFSTNADADSLYNAGNALAYAGKINDAIAAYDQTLALDPNHADALFNKEYLQNQIPSSDENTSSDDDTESGSGDNEKSSAFDPNATATDANTQTPSDLSDIYAEQLSSQIDEDPARIIRFRLYQQYLSQP